LLLEELRARVLADRQVGASYSMEPDKLPDLDAAIDVFREHLVEPLERKGFRSAEQQALLDALGLRR
jgi:hypothetical protein